MCIFYIYYTNLFKLTVNSKLEKVERYIYIYIYKLTLIIIKGITHIFCIIPQSKWLNCHLKLFNIYLTDINTSQLVVIFKLWLLDSVEHCWIIDHVVLKY